MIMPPKYFADVKGRAAARWDQLEGDPDLAGPWHQLFKQVQSPRHILSELLQNADDAGATEARVCIEDDRFVFEHDGEDFIEAHFASLCRFGYSNKRALHTIGFRGIGFKSTFSLGDRVELYSPTLAVAFDKHRFTEPHWIDGAKPLKGATRVEVAIANDRLNREVEKNLEEWIQSPLSLLFFKSVRKLTIGETAIHWESLGPGPVEGSDWLVLDGQADEPFLLVRSELESFPDDALQEIREERMIGTEEGGDFPPCRVEIVLGSPGRLYVVLPTGVETDLPFACNAPFIQDPARMKIKDPDTSPTNRWLLERAGRLAATAAISWLTNTKIGNKERAQAYDLMPDVERNSRSLKGSCAAIAELAFADVIEDKEFLLADDGRVLDTAGCIIAPHQIFEIWPAVQVMSLIDDENRTALSIHVSEENCEKLKTWQLVEEFSNDDFLEKLDEQHFPKPSSWLKLLSLWSYVSSILERYESYRLSSFQMLPVQGQEVLYAATEVVRLGEKMILKSPEDWQFLSDHLIVLNSNWTGYLADQRRETKNEQQASRVENAFSILETLKLSESSDASKIIDRVADSYFASKQPTLNNCVRMAQIAAKLGVTVGSSFRFVTADSKLRSTSYPMLIDLTGSLEDLIPHGLQPTLLLHPDYTASYNACSKEDWQKWVSNGRSTLQTFLPIKRKDRSAYGRTLIADEAKKRGLKGTLHYPYVSNSFSIEDWDFDESCWKHWETLSKDNPNIWGKIAGAILDQSETYWKRASNARILHVATNSNKRSTTSEQLLPAWILKLRELPCLPDTRGDHLLPSDLMLRTAETEPFLDVEPFVHRLIDREGTRALLQLLGVRDKPAGAGRLLDRLRTLARAGNAPSSEVEKWYRRLDQLLDNCATDDTGMIKQAFQSDRLILDQNGQWLAAGSIFLSAGDSELPDTPMVRPSVSDLSLWTKVGVADRPTVEAVMRWLQTIPASAALPAEDARRIRSLLARFPERIWNETGHWLNLIGEWVPVSELSYNFSMQGLSAWGHLHDWVKRQTADLRSLSADVGSSLPFSTLTNLFSVLDEKPNSDLLGAGELQESSWLTVFGTALARIELGNVEETEKVRAIARRIADIVLVEVPKLAVRPYLNGIPAGTEREADLLWIDGSLYITTMSKAKLAKRLPEVIGRILNADVQAALAYAFGRSASDIRAYLEENFNLAEELEPVSPVQTATPAATDANSRAAPKDHPTSDNDGGDGDEASTAENDFLHTPEQSSEHSDEEDSLEDDFGDDKIEPFHNSTPRRAPQPPKPSIIERFAASRGYRRDNEHRYYHSDGSWIAKASDARFPWEHRSSDGELQVYYYPKDHCLEMEPLQIEADIWGMVEKQPNRYAFILSNMEGAPVELTGNRLRAMREGGEISIHPATYRLVYDLDQ